MIYDDDHYYMGGVLAEALARQGCQVTLITPAPMISYWSQFTLEQERIERRLLELGVALYPRHTLAAIRAGYGGDHPQLDRRHAQTWPATRWCWSPTGCPLTACGSRCKRPWLTASSGRCASSATPTHLGRSRRRSLPVTWRPGSSRRAGGGHALSDGAGAVGGTVITPVVGADLRRGSRPAGPISATTNPSRQRRVDCPPPTNRSILVEHRG